MKSKAARVVFRIFNSLSSIWKSGIWYSYKQFLYPSQQVIDWIRQDTTGARCKHLQRDGVLKTEKLKMSLTKTKKRLQIF